MFFFYTVACNAMANNSTKCSVHNSLYLHGSSFSLLSTICAHIFELKLETPSKKRDEKHVLLRHITQHRVEKLSLQTRLNIVPGGLVLIIHSIYRWLM